MESDILSLKKIELKNNKVLGKKNLKIDKGLKMKYFGLKKEPKMKVQKKEVTEIEQQIYSDNKKRFIKRNNKSQLYLNLIKIIRFSKLMIINKILNNIQNKKRYIIIFRNNTMAFINLMLIIFSTQILPNLCINQNNFSNITFTIKRTGDLNMFLSSFRFDNEPDLIYINGESKNPYYDNYELTQDDNIVELTWFNQIIDFENIFDDCRDITEIDLSNCDTSNVTNMKSMFDYCSQLISLNLSNLDTSKVTNMNSMFSHCSQLISLNLENFDTSKVLDMNSMFNGCSKLSYLNLENFDTSKVKDMNSMFQGCSKLAYLNLDNFDTSQVTDMNSMFDGCSSLISLNLSFFETSKVTNMNSMFNGCSSLSSLDLSNFNTSNVTLMNYMFRDCSKLSSLNILNFDTSTVKNLHEMFYNCSSLTSLNLSHFNTSNCITLQKMFYGCINLKYINMKNFKNYTNTFMGKGNIFGKVPDNVVICLNEYSNILEELVNKTCYTLTCLDDWEIEQKKVVNKSGICFDNFNRDIFYKYEYKGKYYEECINRSLINNASIKNCTCDFEKCSICPNEPLKENYCVKCNNNYYPKENDSLNIYQYIKCYKDLEGYYVDKNEYLYKNMTEKNYSNFYLNCSYYHYFDKNNNHCTSNFSCPKEYPKLIIDKMECIKNTKMKNVMDEIIIQYEKNETIKKSKGEVIEYYDSILKSLEIGFTSEYFDTSDLDNGKEEILVIKIMAITFTTTKIQMSNSKANMTNIDLGECEKKLRDFYNLTKNETLYIIKLDIFQEGLKIPKVVYDVYSKLSGANLIKLNLSVCQNCKISLSIPIVITENLDKLNSSSGYYNDICYVATSNIGTDISLKDRKEEFINNNKTVCQEDCDFSEYDYDTQRAKCSCKVKQSSNSLIDMNINTTKILENFKNIKNIVNLNLLICKKSLFTKEGIYKNIGFYILVFIILIHIISIFLFYLKQYELIKNTIKKIIYGLKNVNIIKYDKIEKNKLQENYINNNTRKFDNKNDDINYINIENNNDNLIHLKNRNKNRKKKKKKKARKYQINPINNNNNKFDNNIINNIIIDNNIINERIENKKVNINYNSSYYLPKGDSKTDDIFKIEEVKNIMEYNDDEINALPYYLAIQYDKRSFCVYYISLIKTKHIIIFPFFYNKDYNSKIIKIDLFFIGFTIYYTVNALFYNDSTMHNIYINNGTFDMEYKLPKIVYSSLISIFLNTLLKHLALSNEGIINFKQSKDIKNVERKGETLKNKLSIKFALFFIISFIFLLFFWYYLAMFCAIYRNTQYHLIEDTLISFGFSLLYPLVIYLIPGFLRIPSLYNYKKKKEYLYKFSKILQMF